MIIQLMLFARARDLAGADTLTVDVADNARIGDLRNQLRVVSPALAPVLSQLLFSIDEEFAADSEQLRADARVACFPPVSGG